MQYDFRYDDSDTLLRELSEFFAYNENESLPDLLAEFQEAHRRMRPDADQSTSTPWTSSSPSARRSFVLLQFEALESRSVTLRVGAAKTLLYLVMGSFAECNGPEEQLHWVMENARLVAEADGAGAVAAALQEAMRRHDALR